MTLLHHPQPALLHARDTLATLRATLADRELQLAALRRDLKAFETRYLTQVGVLYAELDDLAAQIAEHELRLYDSEPARQRAAEARRRAHETHEAAFGSHEPPLPDPDPTLEAALKKLFRDLARRIHPDLAQTPADAAHHTRLMARANKAYARADAAALQRLLDDFLETEPTAQEDLAAELLRLHRQIAHAQRDLAAADLELATLPTNEIAQLKRDADAAHLAGHDLLAGLAATLQARLADAHHRLHFLQRQLLAFGR